VPLHKLINRIYGTFTEGKIEWDIKATDEKGLLDYLENRRILDNKKAIVQEILSSKEIAIKSLKGKTKLPINLIKDTVKALQEKGFVEIIYKAPKIYNGFLTIKNVEAFEALLRIKNLRRAKKIFL